MAREHYFFKLIPRDPSFCGRTRRLTPCAKSQEAWLRDLFFEAGCTLVPKLLMIPDYVAHLSVGFLKLLSLLLRQAGIFQSRNDIVELGL